VLATRVPPTIGTPPATQSRNLGHNSKGMAFLMHNG
jgi:hypothetical protein